MEKVKEILGLSKDDGYNTDLLDYHAAKPRFPFELILVVGLDWFWVFLGAIFQGAGSASPMFFYIVFQNLTDTLLGAFSNPGGPAAVQEELRKVTKDSALYMLYIAIGVGAANGIAQGLMNYSKNRINHKIKTRVYVKLLSLEQGFYDVRQAGDLLSHFNEDVSIIMEAWGMKSAIVAGHLVTFCVGIGMSFSASWLQTLIMAAAIPPMAIGALFGGAFYLLATKKSSDANAKCVGVANEVIAAMKTVRSMAGELKEKQRFGRRLLNLGIVSYIKTVVMSTAFGLAFFAIWGIVAFNFWFGGILVTDGIDGKFKITIGQLFQLFGVSLFAIISVAQTAVEMGYFFKSVGAAVALGSILHRKEQVRAFGGKTIPKEELKGKIEFRNVSFKYPSRPDVIVLEDFNLTIEAGKQVAFVGESGSGKSTIVALIENLYLPYEGAIYLDGYDIKELDPIWLHRTIGIVSQEPVLFSCSVTDNITYALTEERLNEIKNNKMKYVEEAAEKANALEFIKKLPDGFDTVVGERGALLSGGQKQRVAIARAVIQNPTILLLDEATSALDNASEQLVQDALDDILKGSVNRTSVSIAHRLSTIQNSDEIIVMKKGKIVERGNHRELIELNGYYFTLAAAQMMHQLDDEEEKNDEKAEVSTEQQVEHVAIVPTGDEEFEVSGEVEIPAVSGGEENEDH